ncbi:type III secretion protein D [Paraburkholderia sp. BL23I1N1]|uniref:type III secretion protein n=1 Tax=Paraburkholderia sp. BL23I1N1 TaxID=1938802 RepID=UPI000E76EC0B|nr:type III secretion protein [Paraburkholderia sp. BL23I1N1]RKE40064.1 type III secretion protein D [Paraburkholderia sp. BL23I1N1]
MKLLRILTGVHAGAQLQLSPGTHRVGTDDDADIRLTDWRGADALLHVDASGVVSAQRVAAAAAQTADTADTADAVGMANPAEGQPAQPAVAEEVVLLVDFVPMQFDDMILCVGADDAVWPSDLDLLSMLLTRPAEARFAAERKKRHRYVGAVVACFALGIVIVAGSLLTTTQMSRAALPRNADDRAQRVSEALAAAHVSGLQAHAVGNTVVVTGMVTSPADDDAVRNLLARISTAGISRNYDVAQNDARSIEDSLGVAGAHVRYLGEGNFAVTGAVSSRADLDAALARVRADLDPNVKNVLVEAAENANVGTGTAAAASYSEMISSDDVRYAQTPDGVKHIYAVDPPASESDAAASASAAVGASGASGVAVANGNANTNTANAANAANTVTRSNPANASIVDNDTVTRSAASVVPLPNPATLPPAQPRSPS